MDDDDRIESKNVEFYIHMIRTTLRQISYINRIYADDAIKTGIVAKCDIPDLLGYVTYLCNLYGVKVDG